MPRQRPDPMAGFCAALAAAAVPWLVATAEPAAPAGSPAVPPPPPPALEIRLGEAVLAALTNNRALHLQRLTPAIRQTYEDEERAAFDPVFSADAVRSRTHPGSSSTNAADAADSLSGSAGISQTLPTGTRLGATLAIQRQDTERAPAEYETRAEISVTQALLQGRPAAANLARLRQARLDTALSEYELRGFAETLVADVERAYWECVLAGRRVGIFQASLDLADQQLKELDQRIRVGTLAETEMAAARAEIASRREMLINARSELAAARLRLIRLAYPAALEGPQRDITLLTEPAVPAIALDPVESHVAVGLRMRPDLNQARLQLERGEIEVVKTRNGLLPQLDLFVRLGDTGYARSFGDSASEIDGERADVSAGLQFQFPPANRAARARHRRAALSREQAAEAVNNMADLVRVDVQLAYIEVERTREQISATATTRRFQEEKVRAETAKFNVGRSTTLLVAQAQRDLVESQVAEVEAVVRHLEALVGLFRLEGSLLERRGIAAPGRAPPEHAAER